MMEVIRRLLYYHALVPYLILGNTFTFMGPLHRLVKKPSFLEKIFPNYDGWELVVFNDHPFDFCFLENQLYFPPSLEVPDSTYIT